MVDYVFVEARIKRGEYPYVPCGVWAMSETQFEVGYLQGFEARAVEVDAWLTELVMRGIRPEKVEGFLQYWRERRSPLQGSFSEIIEVYGSLGECVEKVVGRIMQQRTSSK